MGVQGGGSRCSVVCPCSVLPQTFLSNDNGIFFRMVLHLLCLEVQVLLHQQRRRTSHWTSRQPTREASRCPSRHEGIMELICHPLPEGFSGVHETSFNIQSCSYQAGRGHLQPTFKVSAKILFGHQNDIAAMLESDKRQK